VAVQNSCLLSTVENSIRHYPVQHCPHKPTASTHTILMVVDNRLLELGIQVARVEGLRRWRRRDKVPKGLV
jgi:hypothetical protein